MSLAGPVRQFSKPGGLSQALTDFHKVSQAEVKRFTTENGVNYTNLQTNPNKNKM